MMSDNIYGMRQNDKKQEKYSSIVQVVCFACKLLYINNLRAL